MEVKMSNGKIGDNTPQLQREVKHYSLETTMRSFTNTEIFIGKGDYPMKVKSKKIQEIREKLMIKDHTHLYIEFDVREVYDRFPERGISALWKKFSNGLVKYDNTENRSWYKNLDISGFYTYNIYKDRIELSLLLDKVINPEELINRLQFLCPIKTYKIGENKQTELIETDSSLFGDYRLNISKWT